jgi:hypothetical protein
MKKALVFAAALAAAALVSQSAGATTIVSTFGPGNTYNGAAGFLVGGSGSYLSIQYNEAAEFAVSSYFDLEQIDLAVQNLAGTNTAKVSLWTKSASGGPGYELASWTIGGMGGYNSSSNSPVTISGITGITLAAGAHYFLAVQPVSGSDDSAGIWNLNSIGAPAVVFHNYGYGWWNTGVVPSPAFDLIGTKAPEPATIALVFGGIAGAMRLRRRAVRK